MDRIKREVREQSDAGTARLRQKADAEVYRSLITVCRRKADAINPNPESPENKEAYDACVKKTDAQLQQQRKAEECRKRADAINPDRDSMENRKAHYTCTQEK